jgi:hypothetical protein
MSLKIFYNLLWLRLCMGMKKYTSNRAYFFVHKKYTTFSSERIVALRSVNKVSLESHDFPANLSLNLSSMHGFSGYRMRVNIFAKTYIHVSGFWKLLKSDLMHQIIFSSQVVSTSSFKNFFKNSFWTSYGTYIWCKNHKTTYLHSIDVLSQILPNDASILLKSHLTLHVPMYYCRENCRHLIGRQAVYMRPCTHSDNFGWGDPNDHVPHSLSRVIVPATLRLYLCQRQEGVVAERAERKTPSGERLHVPCQE